MGGSSSSQWDCQLAWASRVPRACMAPAPGRDRRRQESLRLLSGQMEKLWWPGLRGAGDQLCAALPHWLAFWRVVLDKRGCREHGEEPCVGSVRGGDRRRRMCGQQEEEKRGVGEGNTRGTGQQLIWNKGDPVYKTNLQNQFTKIPFYSHSSVYASLEAEGCVRRGWRCWEVLPYCYITVLLGITLKIACYNRWVHL